MSVSDIPTAIIALIDVCLAAPLPSAELLHTYCYCLVFLELFKARKRSLQQPTATTFAKARNYISISSETYIIFPSTVPCNENICPFQN